MKKFLFVTDFGDAHIVESGENTLETLQRLVDGRVDVVVCDGSQPTVNGMDCWVNDEGLFRGDFGINLVASILSGRQLVGPAVFTRSDDQGATIGLTERDITNLTDRVGLLISEDGKVHTVDEVLTIERGWRTAS